MNETSTVFPEQPVWESDGTHRIPFVAYTSDEIYCKELERFFYKGHWCYVGLEAEVPNPGDFKRTVVGEPVNSPICTLGTCAARSLISEIPRFSSASWLKATMEIGTSCSDSMRFSAVTKTSSSAGALQEFTDRASRENEVENSVGQKCCCFMSRP